MNYSEDEDILPLPDTAIEYKDNTEEEEGDVDIDSWNILLMKS